MSVFEKLASQRRDYNKYEINKLEKEVEGCSFKPDIDKSSNKFKTIDASSLERKIPIYYRN